MMPPELREVANAWRQQLMSEDDWKRDAATAVQPGEAGGFRVVSTTCRYPAYLKPTVVGDQNTPRAANEKIVADLAHDLGANVPPVLLYNRSDALIGEETRCCVSLVMYPVQYPWGMIWDVGTLPAPARELVRAALGRYSGTFALDTWIGQTDRNNQRNAIIGVDTANPVNTGIVFLDHAFTLNHQNRWHNGGWKTMELPPVPSAFRECLHKPSVLEFAGLVAHLSDEVVQQVVSRMPVEFMTQQHRTDVIEGLNNRKRQLCDFLNRTL